MFFCIVNHFPCHGERKIIGDMSQHTKSTSYHSMYKLLFSFVFYRPERLVFIIIDTGRTAMTARTFMVFSRAGKGDGGRGLKERKKEKEGESKGRKRVKESSKESIKE